MKKLMSIYQSGMDFMTRIPRAIKKLKDLKNCKLEWEIKDKVITIRLVKKK